MQKLQFLSARSIDEAAALLQANKARVLAGGTDIIPRMRRGQFPTDALVDLSKVGSLNTIEQKGDEIRIGACTTFSQIAVSEILQNAAPSLTAAALTVGCPQTRNRATIAGNLANASPAADSAPPLLVLDARLMVVSQDGTREIPLTDFFSGPGKTSLQPGELITEIRLPMPVEGSAQVFLKLGKRKGMAIAVASCAVYLELDNQQRIQVVRAALGSVAPTPKRFAAVESFLIGKSPSLETLKEASLLVNDEIAPISDIRGSAAYRRKAAVVLMERCLQTCLENTERKAS